MPRPKKHPEHKEQTEKLMNELLNSLVSLWTSEKDPQLQCIAEELGISAAKVRKLLISAGVRDGKRYYENPMADRVLKLWKEKKTVTEISETTGLSKSSVTGYTPHSKTIYSLDTMSTEAERIKLYRSRRAVVGELQAHTDLLDEFDYLWKTVVAFQLYPFKTSGRGKDHFGAMKFRYSVSRSTGAGGRHYKGKNVEGYGNELWIEGKEKSISRSTVELAYRNGRALQAAEGCVTGPKRLQIPGASSYLYAMFLRFGVITSE